MSRCLNLKNPDVKTKVDALVKESGASESSISAEIIVWQNKQGNEDIYPTLQELRESHFDDINGNLYGKSKIVTEYHQENAAGGFAYSKEVLGKDAVESPKQGKDVRGRTVYRYTVKAPEGVVKPVEDIEEENPSKRLRVVSDKNKIQNLFREDNDLAEIGNQEQYSQYLNSIKQAYVPGSSEDEEGFKEFVTRFTKKLIRTMTPAKKEAAINGDLKSQKEWMIEEISEFYDALRSGTEDDIGEETLGLFRTTQQFPAVADEINPYFIDIIKTYNSFDFDTQFEKFKAKKTAKGQAEDMTADSLYDFINDLQDNYFMTDEERADIMAEEEAQDYIDDMDATFEENRSANSLSVVPKNKPGTQTSLFEKNYHPEEIIDKYNQEVQTIVNGMRNITIADDEDYELDKEDALAKKHGIEWLTIYDDSKETIDYIGHPVTEHIYYSKGNKKQAELIRDLHNENKSIPQKEYESKLGLLLQYNEAEVKKFAKVTNEEFEKYKSELRNKLDEGKQTSLFSFDKDTTQDEQLNKVLKSVLSKLGVSYNEVSKIFDDKGKVVKGATGQAGINKNLAGNLIKFIKLVQGEAGTGVLAEETVHMVIEMLPKEGALFQGMFKQIQNFKEYQEVKNDPKYIQEYGDDDFKMRKEAMGKLVSRILIDKDYDPEAVETKKAVKWWDKILEFFGLKFTKAAVDVKAFKDLAEKIFAEDISGLSDKNAEEGLYYNVKNVQKEVLDKIMKVHNSMKRHNVDNPDGSQPWYTKLVNGVEERVKSTVNTEKKKKFDKKYPEPEPYNKRKYDLIKNYGIKIHKDIDNIIKRKNDPNFPKEISTTSDVYNELKGYIDEITSTGEGKNFLTGTIFLSEIMVLDKGGKGNIGSTIDFLAIEPDGKVSTLDWKSMVFIKDEKEVFMGMRKYKEEQNKWQMAQYGNILNDYGIKEQRFQRLMPIEIILKENYKDRTSTPTVAGVKLGNLKGLTDEKLSYLNPVPIENEPGDKPAKYGEFVKKLLAVHEAISENKLVGREANREKAIRLGKLMKAIRDIQVSGNLKMFVDFAENELDIIESNFRAKNTNVISKNLKDWKIIVDVINGIHKDFKGIYGKKRIGALKDSLEIDPKIAKEFDKLATSETMDDVQAYLTDYAETLLSKAASEAGTDLTKSAPEVGFMMRLFGSLNLWNHPMFKTLWSLINKSKEKTRLATQKLFDDIKIKTASLTQSDYDKIINPETGNLIHPYSPEYYELINKLVEDEDWGNLKKIITIKDEELKKHIAERKKEIEGQTVKSGKDKFRIQKELVNFVKTTDIYNSPSALSMLGRDGKNFLWQYIEKIPPTDALKNKYYSKEYNAIKGNKNLLDFYNFFKEKIDEFREYLPVDINGNFVPNIKADLLEKALSDNSGTIGKEDLFQLVSSQINPETSYFMGEVDEVTGKMKNTIPLYFVKNVDGKSKDLPKLLYMFGAMAHNYKNMEEIEGTVSLLREALENSKQNVLSPDGKTIMKDFSTALQEKVVSLDDLKNFDEFVGHYLYGKRYNDNLGFKKITKKVKTIKDGKEVIEEIETYRDYQKLAINIKNWYSKVALGFSPVSGVAAAAGATGNAFFVALKNQFFTVGQLRESFGEVGRAFVEDSSGVTATKALGIIRAFDLADAENNFKKANELSSLKLNHYSASDTLMFMLRGADNGVSNAVLLSLLKHHTIEDNEIVRMDQIKNKALKSIYDQLESKDGKLDNLNKILTDEQFGNFRARTYRLMSTIVGTNGRNDMNLMRMGILGDMIMQFKTWMPMMVHERFAGVNYDKELDAITKGKYMAFSKVLINEHFIPMLGETIKTVIGMENSKEFDAKIEELYNEELSRNATLKEDKHFTLEAYREMYIGNLRSTMVEIVIITGFAGIIMLAKSGDAPDKKDKLMVKMMNRVMNEFTFFVNPNSFIELIGSGVPVVHFLQNNVQLAKHFTAQTFGVATGNVKIKKEATPMKYLIRDFPGPAALERQLELWKDWLEE